MAIKMNFVNREIVNSLHVDAVVGMFTMCSCCDHGYYRDNVHAHSHDE